MTLTVEEKKIRFPVDLTPANDVLADFLVVLDSVTNAYTFATRVINSANVPIDPVAAVGGGIPVVSGGYEYETVAASQTAQALGATGATGDYLSHLTVYPQTTTPGVVTILDNAIEVGSFPGGASSVSNLVPFTIPVGLISVSGAWKITTGANLKVVAHGNFT